MFNRLTIKELAALCHVSTRTLRFYEQAGLIHAERLENNYRIYTFSDVSRIDMILTLKKSGLELREIREILSDSQTLGENLLRQRENLQAEICMLEKRLAFIDRQQYIAQQFRERGSGVLDVREVNIALPEIVRRVPDGEIAMVLDHEEQRIAVDAGSFPQYYIVHRGTETQTRCIASAFLTGEHRLPHLRRKFMALLEENGVCCTSLIYSEGYCLISEEDTHYLWCEVARK